MLVLSLWVVSAPKSLRAAVPALCVALMPPCTTRYLQPPPALPLLSKVRCSNLGISFQLSELPPPHRGAGVPGALGSVSARGRSCCAGRRWLRSPRREGRIRALISA